MAPTAPPGYLRSQLLTKLPYPERSFEGQVIIVTGSNTGMGLEAARHLVRLDAAKVILAVRNLDKGRAAAESIVASTDRCGIAEVWHLDLQSYASVKSFASKAEELERLDVVIANAGVLTRKFSLAEDNETNIKVNVLSTMYLSLLLLPKLRQTSVSLNKDVVLTFTGSFVHWMTDFSERYAESMILYCADEATANMRERYYVSKLMQLLAFRALAAELSRSSKPGRIITSLINPGFVSTDVLREMDGPMVLLYALLKKALSRTAEEGSRTLIHAAEGGAETHGQYLNDCQIGEVSPFVASKDGFTTQERLWKELTDKFESLHPGIRDNI